MHRLPAAALAGLLLFAAPARAEIVESAPGSFVTRDTAVVSAEPQAVWLQLISPGNWWNDAHTWSGDASNMSITPQGGGCFCERIPATETDGAVGLEGSVQHMVVLQAFPRKVLRMRGALGPLQSEPVEGVLTITLKPMEKGTRILWEYVVGGHMRYDAATIAKAVDGVMSQQLDGLAGKLGRIDDPDAKTAPSSAKPDGMGGEPKPDRAKGPAPKESAICEGFLGSGDESDKGNKGASPQN